MSFDIPSNGRLQVITPFSFPDGDGFQIYLEERGPGVVRITDCGHTRMHLSYENDEISKFLDGTRGRIFESIIAPAGIRDDGGQLVMDAYLSSLGESIIRYGEALARVCEACKSPDRVAVR